MRSSRGGRWSLRALGAWMAACACTLAVPALAHADVAGFEPAGTFDLAGGMEVLDVTKDGLTLVHTSGSAIGIVDITDPAQPRTRAQLPVGGDVTSVAATKDNRYVLAAGIVAPRSELVVADLAEERIVRRIALDNYTPDALKVSDDGRFAVLAMESETNLTQGSVVVVRLTGAPREWTVTDVPLPVDDPALDPVQTARDGVQPEFVDIRHDNIAAITLQENNAVAYVDLETRTLQDIVSWGTVSRLADLANNGEIAFNDAFSAPRAPDGIAFTADGEHLVTADEGERDRLGGRAWSIHSTGGETVFDGGLAFEQMMARRGLYPESRSRSNGIEMEGADVATFDGRELAFLVSERSDFLTIWDLADREAPVHVQTLTTHDAPEMVLARPDLGLVFVANEGGNGTFSVYRAVERLRPDPERLEIVTPPGVYWEGIDGLAALSAERFMAVNSANAVRPARIFTVDRLAQPQSVVRVVTLSKPAFVSRDVAPDPLVRDAAWVVGTDGGQPRAIHVAPSGTVDREIPLTGLSNPHGIAVSADGATVYVAANGAFAQIEGETVKRHPLPSAGLNIDLARTPAGDLAVLEINAGPEGEAYLRRLSLAGLADGEHVATASLVATLPALTYPSGNYASLAVTPAGDAWVGRTHGTHDPEITRMRGLFAQPLPEAPPATSGYESAPLAGTTAFGSATSRVEIQSVTQAGSRLIAGGTFTVAGAARTGNATLTTGAVGEVAPASLALGGTPSITAAISDGEGGRYIAGRFTSVGGVARAGLARVNGDGAVHADFDPALNAGGSVLALHRSGGKLYVGGSFSAIDGAERRNFAVLDAVTGEPAADATPAFEEPVQAIQAGGEKVYVGGGFGLERIDAATGVLDAAWASGIQGPVPALAASAETLYVGGGALSAISLATGAPDVAFAPAPDGEVRALALAGTTLYAAGQFTGIGGGTRPGLAALNALDGSLVAAFDAGRTLGLPATTLLVHEGDLYAGLAFGSAVEVDGIAAHGVVRYDAVSGALDTRWDVSLSGTARALVPAAGGIWAGGEFEVAGAPRTGLAALDAVSGALDRRFRADAIDGQSYAVAADRESIYFSGVVDDAVRLVRLDPVTGDVDRSFTPELASASPLFNAVNARALLLHAGRLYVGGHLNTADGYARNHAAALDPRTGALIKAFKPDFPVAVESLALAGGRLVAGGSGLLAAVDAQTGARAAGFSPPRPVGSAPIRALAADGRGGLYVGGTLTGGPPRLARVDAATGALDAAFAPLLEGRANDLALSSGRVYVAGPDRVAVFDAVTGATDPWEAPGAALSLEQAGGRLWAGASAFPAIVPAVPVNLAPPTVQGAVGIGRPLTATPGTWAPAATSYAFEWLRDGAPIATGMTYVPVEADEGHALSVRVIARVAAGDSAPATSTAVTLPLPGAPVNLVRPVVDGPGTTGSTVTCIRGQWTNPGGLLGYSYRWLRNGDPVEGATGVTYVLSDHDLGRTVSCAVEATGRGGATVAVSAGVVVQVAADPVWQPSPGADGRHGADGAAGVKGETGATGPRGPAGRDVRVTCTVKKSRKRQRVTCKVTRVPGRSAATLIRNGRTYAKGTVADLRATRRVKPGRYELRIGAGKRAVRIR